MFSNNNKLIWKISGISIIIFSLIFLLVGCSPISSEEIINQLLPNLWVFISHVFAMIILLSIVIWLVWKPTSSALEKRHNFIANEIASAEKANYEALKNLEESNSKKMNAHIRADEIIENAQKEAFDISVKAKLIAQKETEKIKKDFLIEWENKQKALENNANDQTITIAIAAAEALIKKEIDFNDNENFLNEIIEKIKKEK